MRIDSIMVLCLETVQNNIGVNIGVDPSRRYAIYGHSDSDRVRCFTCLASTHRRVFGIYRKGDNSV